MSGSAADSLPCSSRQVVLQPADAARGTAPSEAIDGSDDNDSSDDDTPIAARQVAKKESKAAKTPKHGGKPAVKKGAQGVGNGSSGKNHSHGEAANLDDKKGRQAKPAASKAAGGEGVALISKPGVEKAKKTYSMPGQSRDAPPEGDPLRRFYTSLLEQRPGSEMARRWCAMHGLLEREDAEAWAAENARKKSGSPTKGAPPRLSAATALAKNKKRRAEKEDGEKEGEEEEEEEASRPVAKKKAGAAAASSKRRAQQVQKSRKKGGEAAAAGAGSDSQSDSQSDNDKSDWGDPLARKQMSAKGRPAAKPNVKAKASSGSSALKKKSERDVAFLDGGMDGGSDSEDDIPLVQRKKKTV